LDAFLDTSILIDIYRGYAQAVTWAQTNRTLRLSIISTVWMESVSGVTNKVDQTTMRKLLDSFPITLLTPTDQEWAMQQLQAYRLSHGVGMNDCLIAAPAHRLQLPLYTRNLKHFTPLLGGLAVRAY
jgi:predicted nucleic acid-binding protein